MRVLLLNRFFWPDESATSLLLTDLAEDLAARGHEVHVLCARLLYDRPGSALPTKEHWRGVTIHRLWSTSLGRHTTFRRMADSLSFQASLGLLGTRVGRPDLIFTMTDPPMLLAAARWIRIRRGGALVHHVDDVYPDIAVALGVLDGKAHLTRALQRLYRRLLRAPSLVIALGDCMAEVLAKKGVPGDKLRVVRPWADGEQIVPRLAVHNPLRRELGYRHDDVVVMYSGNMGRGHRFDTILGAVRELQEDRHIHFLFVGGGPRRREIEEVVQRRALQRVRIRPYEPRERLGASLAAGDIHLVSLDDRATGLIVPSKLAGILAAGRPAIVVGAANSDPARSVRTWRCGEVVEHGEVDTLTTILRQLATDADLRQRLGASARNAFEQHYSRRSSVASLIDEMERIAH